MAIQSVSNGPFGAPPKKGREKSVRRILERLAARAAKTKKGDLRSFLSQPIPLPSLSTIRAKATLYVVILLAATVARLWARSAPVDGLRVAWAVLAVGIVARADRLDA